ncbi:hypothetical protein BC828DRAFT_387024 [Blastocladiella britannica]|nr:hypothetical protein BC828DRAFT_387024 [Blastocladiella britannica]
MRARHSPRRPRASTRPRGPQMWPRRTRHRGGSQRRRGACGRGRAPMSRLSVRRPGRVGHLRTMTTTVPCRGAIRDGTRQSLACTAPRADAARLRARTEPRPPLPLLALLPQQLEQPRSPARLQPRGTVRSRQSAARFRRRGPHRPLPGGRPHAPAAHRPRPRQKSTLRAPPRGPQPRLPRPSPPACPRAPKAWRGGSRCAPISARGRRTRDRRAPTLMKQWKRRPSRGARPTHPPPRPKPARRHRRGPPARTRARAAIPAPSSPGHPPTPARARPRPRSRTRPRVPPAAPPAPGCAGTVPAEERDASPRGSRNRNSRELGIRARRTRAPALFGPRVEPHRTRRWCRRCAGSGAVTPSRPP